LWQEIEKLDGKIGLTAQTKLFLEVEPTQRLLVPPIRLSSPPITGLKKTVQKWIPRF